MQIHELNNFTGTLGSGAYLAVDDGNDTGKLSTQQLLAATEARIDNIIAGPAPSAEEIVDARFGDDGVTYPSLGDAIRDQVGDLKSAISEAYTLSLANLCKADGVEILEQTYINGTSVVDSQANYFSLRYIPCEAGKTYLFYCDGESQHRARFVNFYNSSKTYLSQATFATEVIAPTNSEYMSVSFTYADAVNLGKGTYYVKKEGVSNNSVDFGSNDLKGTSLQSIRTDISELNSLYKTTKWNLAEDGELILAKMCNSGSQVVGQTISLADFYNGYTVKVPVEQGIVYFCNEEYANNYGADGYNGQYCARFACFADENDKFIEGYSYPYSYASENYAVPANAKYLYVTFVTLNQATAAMDTLGWYWITQKQANEHINQIDLADSVLTKKVVVKNTQDIETLQDVQELRKPTFVFIFDDGNSTDIALKTLFDNYGYKCGFALVASVADEVRLKARYLPFQEDGFEVLAHSVNGTAFSTITDLTTAESYMSDALSRLTSWGFNVKGWVTPSTWLLEAQMPILKKYYQYGFGHLTGSAEGVAYHTLAGKDIRQLDRWSLESKTVQQTKDAIDDCVANDGFMIFYAHTYPNNDSNFTVSNMATILNYLKAMSDNDTIRVLPPREAINYYYRYRWADLVGLLR